MTTWKISMAAALATLVFAGSAFAQATTGSPATGAETKTEQPKGADTMKSDTMKSDKTMRGNRKGGMTMGDEKVKAAQQALKDKGHDPGDVDGKMGPKTQAALRDFQKAQGMQATGRLDMKTMQSLGMDGGKTSSTGSSATSGSASPTTTTDAPKDEEKK